MPDVLKVIGALQEIPEINNDDIITVEWAFLPTKRYYPRFRPKRIEERLTTDPMFFCEVIKLTYRSDKGKDFGEEVSEQQRAEASLTWNLLKDWRLPPGLTTGNEFSKENFESWLKVVQTECERTGYLKVAMNCIGQVLVNVPTTDPNFPMCRDVAEIINNKDSTDILQGYQNGILNLYSTEIVNPQVQPEQKLSLKYKGLAAIMEEQSYYRIATMFREVADHYEDKAIWFAEAFQD